MKFWIIFPKTYIFLIYDWLFESLRNEYNVFEYSIQQTSLEQIFNQFEERQRKSDKQEIEAKTEIPIDDKLLNILLLNNLNMLY